MKQLLLGMGFMAALTVFTIAEAVEPAPTMDPDGKPDRRPPLPRHEAEPSFKKISLTEILTLLPRDGRVGDCTLRLTPIYQNEAKTIIAGFNLSLKGADGKLIESNYQIMPQFGPILRPNGAVRLFASNGNLAANSGFDQVDMGEGSISAETDAEKQKYRLLEFFIDRNVSPPRIVGVNANRTGTGKSCGVVDEKSRMAYEKTKGAANEKKPAETKVPTGKE